MNPIQQLHARLDDVIEFRSRDYEEEDGHFGRDAAIGAAGLGAGATGLAYLRGRAYNAANAGDAPFARPPGVANGLRNIRDDIGAGFTKALPEDFRNMRAGAAGSSLASGARRTGNYISSAAGILKDTAGTYGAHRKFMGASAGRAVAGAGRAALSRLAHLKWSARHAQLIQLNELLDEVIEFRSDDRHTGRNIAIGAGALGAVGTGGAYLRGRNLPYSAPGGLLSAGEAAPGFMGAVRREAGTVARGAQAIPGDIQAGYGAVRSRASAAKKLAEEVPIAFRHYRHATGSNMRAVAKTARAVAGYVR